MGIVSVRDSMSGCAEHIPEGLRKDLQIPVSIKWG